MDSAVQPQSLASFDVGISSANDVGISAAALIHVRVFCELENEGAWGLHRRGVLVPSALESALESEERPSLLAVTDGGSTLAGASCSAWILEMPCEATASEAEATF